MYVVHDHALIDHRRRRLEPDCPTPLMGAEVRPWLRKVTGGHSWIARWSSWLFGTEIQVAPMSGTWLRAHENDWDKHGVDV
jgi:hypothetical protein